MYDKIHYKFKKKEREKKKEKKINVCSKCELYPNKGVKMH